MTKEFADLQSILPGNVTLASYAECLRRDAVRKSVKATRPNQLAKLTAELHRRDGETDEPVSNFEVLASLQLAGF